jgi:hypothetical protein
MDISHEPAVPEMLRFMARHAGPDDWCNLAYLVALVLPGDEAFGILQPALTVSDVRSATNIVQGMAMTKQPGAEAALRQQLERVWTDNALWDETKPVNWAAETATTCIAYLIELGATPAEFEGRVRRLAARVCQRNRSECLRMLSKHYDWLA